MEAKGILRISLGVPRSSGRGAMGNIDKSRVTV